MIVARSTEESVRLIAEALGSLADTVTKMAGRLEEINSRVEHIEEYLESLEEETTPQYLYDGKTQSILPCGYEGESAERQQQLEEIDLSE